MRPLSVLCQSWLFLVWFTKAFATLYVFIVMQIKLVVAVDVVVDINVSQRMLARFKN